MKVFKVTYQDRALNQRIIEIEAPSWSDIVPMAFSFMYKRAEEKLIAIEEKQKLSWPAGEGRLNICTFD